MASTSNPLDNDIEVVLEDIAEKVQNIQALKKKLDDSDQILKEAKKTVKETKAACREAYHVYRPVWEARTVTKNTIEGTLEDCESLLDEYGHDLCTYAASRNQQGILCLTVQDVYIFFILKNHAKYNGALYIKEGSRELIEVANHLNLQHNNMPSHEQATELGMVLLFSDPPDNRNECALLDMAKKGQYIQDLRKKLNEADQIFQEAKKTLKENKASHHAAYQVYGPMKEDVMVSKKSIEGMQEYCQNKVDKYRRDFCIHAYRQYPRGIKCSTLKDVYKFDILKKYGGYRGILYFKEGNHELIEAANLIEAENYLDLQYGNMPRPEQSIEPEMTSSSNHLGNGIEVVLRDIAEKAQRIEEFRKKLDHAESELHEANKTLRETKAAYRAAYHVHRPVKEHVILTKDSIEWLKDYIKDLLNQHRTHFRTYASIRNQQGIICSTVDDVFRYYVLMKYADYDGALYIEEGIGELIEAANFLNLQHNNMPSHEQAIELEMASSFFSPPNNRSEWALLDIARKGQTIQAERKELDEARPKLKAAKETLKQTKTAYRAANHVCRRIKEDVIEKKNAIKVMQDYCDNILDQYQWDLCVYALGQDQEGMECSSELDFYKIYFLKKYGDYKGVVCIGEENHDLIEAAHDLDIDYRIIPSHEQAIEPEGDKRYS